MNRNSVEFRVRYADTDHFGVVYYARYLNWLEAGRTEILRDNGISYAEFEKNGIIAPVVHLEMDYKSPARYDDLIIVETTIASIGNSSVEFHYLIRKKMDQTIIAEGKTINVFVNKHMEKIKVPETVRSILKN